MNEPSDLPGALRFGVSGEGVSIDPATGVLSVLPAALVAGIEVAVTSGIGDGVVTRRFRLALLPEGEAPRLLTAPALLGEPRVGASVMVEPGSWEGATAFAFQWLRDGTDIDGATADTYVPGAEDDLTALSCRVIATGAAGSATAETAALTITWPAPVVSGLLPDHVLEQGSIPAEVEAGAAFTGGGLSFSVTGAGVSIYPGTSLLTVPTDVVRTAETVMVTASNSGGSATTGFEVTVFAVQGVPFPVVPPTLVGDGRIGTAVAVEPGIWSAEPAIAFQWCRDGADIAGATGETYVPAPEDDRAALSCRVTATNAAGSASAETAALAVAWPAPVAAGGLPDLALVQGSGVHLVDAAAAFAGGGLVFAAAGAGVSADPATGRVSVPTDTLLAAAPVTVSASNSGGAASVQFTVSVAAVLLPPAATGSIADVAYPLGSGPQTVSTQAAFAGAGLSFALVEAPAGVTIDAASGLVTIPTDVALAAAAVTVRASNAAGSATRSFAVSVGAVATVFDRAGALADLGFLHSGPAPSLALDAGGFARLVPAATGRAHGVWSQAGGDGLYRVLARWNVKSIGAAGYVPFAFGARIRLDGGNFAGVFVEAYRPGSGPKWLRFVEYTGTGDAATELKRATPGWSWNTWYWVEMALAGASVKARLYPEGTAAPAWQVEATTAATGPGAFGPTGFPLAGESPVVDIRRLEYLPPSPSAPPPAQDGDWTLLQLTEQL